VILSFDYLEEVQKKTQIIIFNLTTTKRKNFKVKKHKKKNTLKKSRTLKNTILLCFLWIIISVIRVNKNNKVFKRWLKAFKIKHWTRSLLLECWLYASTLRFAVQLETNETVTICDQFIYVLLTQILLWNHVYICSTRMFIIVYKVFIRVMIAENSYHNIFGIGNVFVIKFEWWELFIIVLFRTHRFFLTFYLSCSWVLKLHSKSWCNEIIEILFVWEWIALFFYLWW
jgi:hypothetical protein